MGSYTDQQALNEIVNLLSGGTPSGGFTTLSPTQGVKNVASAGTAESLAATGTTRLIVIQAKPGNTGNVYLGDSSVSSSAYGAVLTPGESIGIVPPASGQIDLTEHYIDVDTNGEGVTFMHWG